jgi:hypothetical protein
MICLLFIPFTWITKYLPKYCFNFEPTGYPVAQREIVVVVPLIRDPDFATARSSGISGPYVFVRLFYDQMKTLLAIA